MILVLSDSQLSLVKEALNDLKTKFSTSPDRSTLSSDKIYVTIELIDKVNNSQKRKYVKGKEL